MSAAALLVAGATGTLGGVLIYRAAARSDEALSPDIRSQIAGYLANGGETGGGLAPFCLTLESLFRSVFSERQWSQRGIGRLCGVSAFLLAAAIIIPSVKYPDLLARLSDIPGITDEPRVVRWSVAAKLAVIFSMVPTLGTVFNFIPELLAVWKSRLWLGLIERRPTWLNLVCAALCDILGSLFIDASAAVVITAVDDWAEGPPASLATILSDNLNSVVAGLREWVGIPSAEPTDIVTAAFSIATMMSCLWLALSVAAIALVKLSMLYAGRSGGLPGLDLAARPLRGLGIASGTLVAAMPLVYVLI